MAGSVKKISLQWRLTLMTSLVIAGVCIFLNILLYHTGVFYMDSLGQSVLGSQSEELEVYIEFSEEELNNFLNQFSSEVAVSKRGFGLSGWVITFIITVLGGGLAYLISGYALKPLEKFSEQVEQIQMENITEHRMDEQGVPEFQKLAHSFNTMLSRLADSFSTMQEFNGNAAHEFRTPLATMQARLELYEENSGAEMDEETTELVQLMKEQTERLSTLVKALLDMSEMQTIKRTDKIELRSLIEEVAEDLTPLAEKNQIELRQDSVDEVWIQGSDVLIYRLIFNLVENAIRYNKPGGMVEILADREGDDAVLMVRDTGTGIPEEYQNTIFQPFFRVDKSRSRSYGGIGLGLSIVWKIVQLHDGSIQIVKSSPEGTTFEVKLTEYKRI